MLKLIEKILIKLQGNTKGYDFNVYDWNIVSLYEKYYKSSKPLTKAENYAKVFLEKIQYE